MQHAGGPVPGRLESAGQAAWRQRVSLSQAFTRADLFGGLVLIGIANGVSERVGQSISRDGLAIALLNSFNVSVVVWVGVGMALWKMARSSRRPVNSKDAAVAAVAAACFLMPVPALSWLALAVMAAYIFLSTDRSDPAREGALLLAAVTAPMLWAPLLLAVFSNAVLNVDAKLIGWIVGTPSVGNTVPFADGSGVLFLEPACSSLANISVTMLCGLLFMVAYGVPFSGKVAKAIALACFTTLAVNVFRISAIGIFPAYYDQIHGLAGSLAAQGAATVLMLVIYVERLRPANA